MPRARLASPVLAAIFACGPELPSTSTDAASTSTGSTGASTTADATTAAPTSTASSATATSTTTPGTTEALTTAPATDASTAGPTTTTSTSTTDPEFALYAAMYYAGGLDRIFVRKADFGENLCTEVAFVWPGDPTPGLGLPAMWGLQWALTTPGAADCLDFMKPLQNGETATAVTGTAAWDAMFCPQTLDIDVVATFPQGQPWFPAQVALQAAALPLQGC